MSRTSPKAKPTAMMVSLLFLLPLLSVFLLAPGPVFVVSAAGPPVKGDWTVSSAEAQSNKDILLTGNLTVAAGGVLVLDKVNLRMNCSINGQFNITVKAGGKLTMMNSTVAPSNFLELNRYNFIIEAGGAADLFDTTLSGIGEGNMTVPTTLGLYIGANSVKLVHDTITRKNFLYTAVGVVVGPMASPLIERSDISGVFVTGVFMTMGSHGILRNNTIKNNILGVACTFSDPTIEGNEFNTNFEGAQFLQSQPTLRGNTFRGSLIQALGADGSSLDMDHDSFADNVADIVMNSSGLTATHLSLAGGIDGINIDHSGNRQVILENSSLKMDSTDLTINDSSVQLLNTTFDPSKVKITTPSGNLHVSWFLDTNVTMASGAKASGAQITIKDSFNSTVFSGPADSNGRARWLPLVEYYQIGDTRTNQTPHEVVATKGPLWGNATARMTFSKTVDILIDDLPPVVKILSPIDGLITNRTTLLFSGNATDNRGVSQVEYRVSTGSWAKTKDIDPWNFTVPLPDGTYQVFVRATDLSGLQTTARVNVTVDTIAPSLVIYKPAFDTLTNKSLISVEGKTDTGSSVWRFPSNLSIPVDNHGNFKFDLNLTEGTNDIVLVAKDGAGNQVSRSVKVRLDTVPPLLYIYSPAKSSITNSSKVTVSGRTDSGGNVTITVNGVPIPVALNGTFSYDLLLSDGSYNVHVGAKDEAGNLASSDRDIIVDTVKPKLELDSPDDNFLTRTALITVNGRAQGPSVWVGPIEADTQKDPEAGWWDFSELYPLKEGRNNITIKAQDLAGNKESLVLHVTLDTVPPALNITDPLDGSTTTLSVVNIVGTAEPGANLTLNGAPVDDTDGSFSITVYLVMGQNNFNMTAKDPAGNTYNVSFTITRQKKATNTTLSGDLFPLVLILILICIAVFLLAYNYSRSDEKRKMPKKRTTPKRTKLKQKTKAQVADEEE
jgi:hypothetical protein